MVEPGRLGRSGAATFVVRPAVLDDAAAIAEIYNQGIRGRMATFETEERTADDRVRWLAAHDAHHPCLVAVEKAAGRVVGWISADSYRPRFCYRGIAEFSVYVHEDARGLGVGKRLMEAFIPACAEAGLWKLVSRIFPENRASRGLCAWAGFREVGIYEKHAQLDGVWRDVVIVERLIEENIEPPSPSDPSSGPSPKKGGGRRTGDERSEVVVTPLPS